MIAETLLYTAGATAGVLSYGLRKKRPETSNKLFSFSIIVAALNEEANIPDLLNSLEKLDFPPDRFEIILANDRSTDDTFRLMEDFCSKEENRTAINISSSNVTHPGKKVALQAAADIAKHEFLLITDADCVVPANWLHTFNNYITPAIGMIVGFSPEISGTPFRQFSQMASAGI
ncbi:MAG: glycosyltransferase, partial [Candidatus Cloacimonetes bacterium]|nr:glycosyltransferase [Candidatus Cloacimonadota bacterium]